MADSLAQQRYQVRVMIRRTAISALLLGLLPAVGCPALAGAFTLELPAAARMTAEKTSPMARYRMPVGAWSTGGLPVETGEGALQRRAWSLKGQGLTTMQILAPLKRQLERAGYEVVFECQSRACGGFDFRFNTEVLPEPEMHVDLGDFLYLAAEKPGPEGADLVSLLVSRSPSAGHVQLTRLDPAASGDPAAPPAEMVTSTKSPETPGLGPRGGLISELEADGRAPLDDLSFDTGSANLGEGSFASLADLAAWLQDSPDRHVTLVGHTDAEGALSANIALSRRRAESVRGRLVQVYGVPGAQVTAEGVGYLAPRASNATDAGRLANRRVEVVLAGN